MLFRSGYVVGDPVDALDLVDDAVRDLGQELHIKMVKIRRHAISRCDGAKCANVVVGAGVSHNAYGLDR